MMLKYLRWFYMLFEPGVEIYVNLPDMPLLLDAFV